MYRYIAIERQYCSGGQEIASRLARQLGYKLCDHGVLVEAGKRMDLPAIYITDVEETATESLLFNLAQTTYGSSSKKKSMPLSEQIFETEKQVILDEAAAGSCVFVGRCAGKILMDHGDECLRVFIHASTDYRKERAEKVEKIGRDKVMSEIRRIDKKRADFFVAHSGNKWGARDFFSISLDSGVLGIDTCVDILLAAVSK